MTIKTALQNRISDSSVHTLRVTIRRCGICVILMVNVGRGKEIHIKSIVVHETISTLLRRCSTPIQRLLPKASRARLSIEAFAPADSTDPEVDLHQCSRWGYY